MFRKNPLIYSYNASTLTSEVVVSNFGENTKVDVRLLNRGIRNAYTFSPLYSQYSDEKITHFYFDVTNNDDAIIIYLKPLDFQLATSPNRTLYSVFLSPEPFPTSSTKIKTAMSVGMETNVRNWDSKLGYKMFFDGSVCPKGVCYMGIKPIAAGILILSAVS